MVIRNNIFVVAMTCTLLLLSGLVFSQEPGSDIPGNNTKIVNNTEIQNDSLTIDSANIKMFIDKIEVNVQLEKPQALFILPGTTPDIDDIQIEHSFFNEIFRPVEKRGRIQTSLTAEPAKDRKDYIPW